MSSPYITLSCPSCGARATFPGDAERFECAYCGNQHIFNLPLANRRSTTQVSQPVAVLAGDAPAARVVEGRARPLTPRPRSVTVEMGDQSLTIRWRWFSLKYIPLLFFCIAWDSFLCFWYSMVFKADIGAMSWIMIIFPIAHVAVGLGLSYTVLAGMLNTTTLHVDRRYFTVQHDPVPWLGEVKTPTTQVAQLYCKARKTSSENGTSTSYTLSAVLKDGRLLDLLANLETPEVAAFIEQQVETWLKIPDRPVSGELEHV